MSSQKSSLISGHKKGGDAKTGEIIGTDHEEQASNKSLFANSMSHSFNSFYEFQSRQHTNNVLNKNVNVDKLLSLSSTRRSMFSTPLVEFDTLG